MISRFVWSGKNVFWTTEVGRPQGSLIHKRVRNDRFHDVINEIFTNHNNGCIGNYQFTNTRTTFSIFILFCGFCLGFSSAPVTRPCWCLFSIQKLNGPACIENIWSIFVRGSWILGLFMRFLHTLFVEIFIRFLKTQNLTVREIKYAWKFNFRAEQVRENLLHISSHRCDLEISSTRKIFLSWRNLQRHVFL